MAVNCWLAPGATEATPGDKLNETRDGVEGGGVPPPPPPPEENEADPPLPQPGNSARHNMTNIKNAVFTLGSVARRKVSSAEDLSTHNLS